MSHTKGKWVADRWDGMIYGRESNQAHKGLHHAVFIDGQDLMICPTGLPDDPESEANAKLISASPDLLEALDRLSSVVAQAIQSGDWQVDGACDPDAALRLADKAIRKAKS